MYSVGFHVTQQPFQAIFGPKPFRINSLVRNPFPSWGSGAQVSPAHLTRKTCRCLTHNTPLCDNFSSPPAPTSHLHFPPGLPPPPTQQHLTGHLTSTTESQVTLTQGAPAAQPALSLASPDEPAAGPPKSLTSPQLASETCVCTWARAPI